MHNNTRTTITYRRLAYLSLFISLSACFGAPQDNLGNDGHQDAGSVDVDFQSCTPDTPATWPCSIPIAENLSFYCGEKGICTFLEAANGYAGWDSTNCNSNISPSVKCTYMDTTTIHGCTTTECGHYPRPKGLIEEYSITRCTSIKPPFIPCTVVVDERVYGCTSLECSLPYPRG